MNGSQKKKKIDCDCRDVDTARSEDADGPDAQKDEGLPPDKPDKAKGHEKG